MATNASNVRVAVTGSVSLAPAGTTLPTDNSTVLPAAFTDVGFISSAGIVQSTGESTTDITAWQNASLVRRVQTAHAVTYAFTMIETNAVSLAAYYGNYLAGAVQLKAGLQPAGVWVLQVIDGTSLLRIVCPSGQATAHGDVTFDNNVEVGYMLTVTCYPGRVEREGLPVLHGAVLV